MKRRDSLLAAVTGALRSGDLRVPRALGITGSC